MATLLLILGPLSAIGAVRCCVTAVRSDLRAARDRRAAAYWAAIARGRAPR